MRRHVVTGLKTKKKKTSISTDNGTDEITEDEDGYVFGINSVVRTLNLIDFVFERNF